MRIEIPLGFATAVWYSCCFILPDAVMVDSSPVFQVKILELVIFPLYSPVLLHVGETTTGFVILCTVISNKISI